MYPFGDLPGNLAAFCGTLRRDHEFRLGPGEINDAARVLLAIDISDKQRVRDAWRAILSSSRENAAAFDDAFDRFFFPGPPGQPQLDQPPLAQRKDRPAEGGATGERGPSLADPSADADLDDSAAGDGPVVLDNDPDADDAEDARLARARYSPHHLAGTESIELGQVSPAWSEAARALLRRLVLGLSRRWRPARQGRRFDLRRTWRASLQTGGEAVVARWLRRVHRSPRLVMLVDGSRSMSGAHAAALDMAVALATVTRRLEVCVFSTALSSITSQVRQAGAGRTVRVSLGREVWGGGTSIGDSLRAFLRQHGERHVGPDTVTFIVSDGLDVGELPSLAQGMRELHRRSAAVVWLNPLLDTPGYEPVSRGMVTARPFITTFTYVADAAGLARLASVIRLRR